MISSSFDKMHCRVRWYYLWSSPSAMTFWCQPCVACPRQSTGASTSGVTWRIAASSRPETMRQSSDGADGGVRDARANQKFRTTYTQVGSYIYGIAIYLAHVMFICCATTLQVIAGPKHAPRAHVEAAFVYRRLSCWNCLDGHLQIYVSTA